MAPLGSVGTVERLRSAQSKILAWFSRHGRRFPWRGEVGWYGVLVAEFMLIRTRSEVAEKVFLEFMREYPEPGLLCSSDTGRVLAYFRRLGLPRRAERLVEAVCAVLKEYSGEIPCDYDRLVELPGVGDYIARVLLSRVCGRRYAFADSNVVRVLSRLTGRLLRTSEAARMLEEAFTGGELLAINVALVDLGSMVCKPEGPRCQWCPLREVCLYPPASNR